jgi:hypothetical protein
MRTPGMPGASNTALEPCVACGGAAAAGKEDPGRGGGAAGADSNWASTRDGETKAALSAVESLAPSAERARTIDTDGTAVIVSARIKGKLRLPIAGRLRRKSIALVLFPSRN